MSRKLRVVHYKVAVPKPVAPLRVVLLSDIHERVPKGAADIIKTLAADIIAVSGDTLERYDNELRSEYEHKTYSLPKRVLLEIAYWINFAANKVFGIHNRPSVKKTYDFLTDISRIAPVVMSVGNHEQKFLPEDEALFRRLGITVLDNDDTVITIRGQRVLIGGLSTFYNEKWLSGFAAEKGLKILLSHHPSYFDRFSLGDKADLVLSGHNHGGQVRFFGKGLLSSGEGIPPKYDRGLFCEKLVVSAGLSNTVALPRINNPREIVCVDIVPKAYNND